MNFLYPVFLVGAVAAAIPIVLHFLRRDAAPDVPFSAVRLLRGSPVPQSEPRRLRDLLLLAARVLALLLLAAAFARPPYLTSAAAGLPRVRIVAIDRSFSMGAPGRFAAALARARAAVDEAGDGDRVAVIAFDDRADVIAEPGTSAQARAALAKVEPTFGGTRYAPLFDKASSLAGSPGTAGRGHRPSTNRLGQSATAFAPGGTSTRGSGCRRASGQPCGGGAARGAESDRGVHSQYRA